MVAMTPKQKQILAFIENFIQERGYAPSLGEISEHFGFRSIGTAHHHLGNLKKMGLIQFDKNAIRGIRLESQKNSQLSEKAHEHAYSIPLLGRVAAGFPIEAVLNPEKVEVPSHMIRKGSDYYALRVQGDSMIEDGILSGDLVVVKRQQTARQGQTVVALIDREVTIKRFYQEAGHVVLKPANAVYEPLVIDKDQVFEIQGLVVGVIRSLEDGMGR